MSMSCHGILHGMPRRQRPPIMLLLLWAAQRAW